MLTICALWDYIRSQLDVDFSYCWLNLQVKLYSLEQYIGLIWRQAFIHYCGLLQVWRVPGKLSAYIDTNQNNFQIVGREGHNLARNIKESIYIRVNNPSLNNNIGKFNLSPHLGQGIT